MNKFLIFIILILALLSIGVASAEDSSSFNTTDSDVSICDESNIEEITSVSEVDDSNVIMQSYDDSVVKDSNNVKSFDDLETAINNKSDNSVLDLESDYKYGGSGSFSGITFSKNNFTIDGHGHTIDANNGGRIFYITGSNITLKNLILINAKTTDNGGAIYATAENDNLIIINCTFMDNRVNSAMGGCNPSYG